LRETISEKLNGKAVDCIERVAANNTSKGSQNE